MTPAWMAMVPKGSKPGPPLSVRPISILSSVYRLYASARTNQLQGWARGAFHNWQKAYVRGRSPKAQVARLSHLMDDAALQNTELHVISMDASKAFPSVSRKQVKALLVREGYPSYLFDTVESLYQQGGVHFRYQGSEVVQDEFLVQSGIHQGCPLSVLSFNILMAPLCRKLESLGLPWGIVFADDISFASRDITQLQRALDIVQNHMAELGIVLNRSKTQYWNCGTEVPGIRVGSDHVEASRSILILGMTFEPMHRDKGRTEELVATYRKAGACLSKLPMPTNARAAAFGGIVIPRLFHCPWRSYVETKYLTTMRKDLIYATNTYLAKGCRSAPAVTAHILKGHVLDPLIAPMIKMLGYLETTGPYGIEVIQRAYDAHMPPASPASTFAANLRRLGGDLDDGRWTPPGRDPLHILAPADPSEKQRWLHLWRSALRDTSVSSFSGHRHELRLLRTVQVDQNKTFRLLRNMQPGKERAALEIGLTGGLLTNSRTKRAQGPPHTHCPWGCPHEDSEVHRYWHCPRWSWSRNTLEWVNEDTPELLRMVGWVPIDSPLGLTAIASIQRHMMRVILGSTADFHQNRRRDFEPDVDDNGDDDHDGMRRPDEPGRADEPNAAMGMPQGPNDMQLAPDGAIPREQERGPGGYGEPAPPCPPRLRHREIPEQLPEHIRAGVRRIPSLPHYRRELLACRRCGAIGARLRLTQFLRKHDPCAGGVGDVYPGFSPLTVFEERLLRDAGTEIPAAPPNKRRRKVLEPRHHVDDW